MSAAPSTLQLDEKNADATYGDADGGANYEHPRVSNPRRPYQASSINSDNVDEDSEDKSEEDAEEETRLGPIESLKQRLKAKQQQWLDARRNPIYEWKGQERWKEEHAAFRQANEARRRGEAAVMAEAVAEKERKVRRRAQMRLTKQKEHEFRDSLFQYELDVMKAEKRASLLTQFAREDRAREKQSLVDAEEARLRARDAEQQQQIDVALQRDRQNQLNLAASLQHEIDTADGIGRRSGVLPAIHAPPPATLSEQDETSTILILRPSQATSKPYMSSSSMDSLLPRVVTPVPPSREEAALASSTAKRMFFTVNIKRFKHVEDIRGDGIGDLGGVELARSLLTGACPRVQRMNLGWNSLKHSAMVALSDAFIRGACGQLRTLDLRCNGINVTALAHLIAALEQGGLPELTEIILQGNLLGDEGARALAHAVFRGTFKSLRLIDARQNKIRDGGMLAIWNVFTSESFRRFCPKLQLLDARRNDAQGSLTRSLQPCPSYLEF